MKIDGRTLSHETSETIRRRAVRRVHEGERPSEVIKSYGLCRTSIYRWLRAEKRRGPGRAAIAQSPGAPRQADRARETTGAHVGLREGSPAVRF
jgi:transposase